MAPPLPPTPLEGTHVRLEPLTQAHAAPLAAVGLDPALWEWIPTRVRSADDMRRYVDAALDEWRRGLSLPFATVERATGTVVGSTRFGNVALEHGRVEIGWTWVAPAWQRTTVNSEAKRLMLAHAFEALGCERVELKTDALNARSRAAILRLGAVEEGTLRRHIRCDTGRMRDTVYFSVLRDEWPRVRDRLDARLAR